MKDVRIDDILNLMRGCFILETHCVRYVSTPNDIDFLRCLLGDSTYESPSCNILLEDIFGGYITADIFPFRYSADDNRDFLSIRFKDENNQMCTPHFVQDGFFECEWLDKIDARYLVSIKERGWPSNFHFNDNQNWVVKFFHLYFVIRYRELKYNYRDARIRLGSSLRKVDAITNFCCDDKKSW